MRARPSHRLLVLPLACLACVLALASCDEDKGAAPAVAAQPEGRVNAVMATKKAPTFADLCDVAPDKAQPKAFTWPQLSAAAPDSPGGPSARPGGNPSGYRWVNVWATWCKPCIEELPMLTRVLGDWKKQGQAVELTLVSVDADAAAAQQFIAQHAGTPATLQISDPAQATPWLTSLGLATGSSIPVHMIVDAQGNLVCARSGGISEEDLERFRRALFP